MKKKLVLILVLFAPFVITACNLNEKSSDSQHSPMEIVNDNGGTFTEVIPTMAPETPSEVEEDPQTQMRTVLFFHAEWCSICKAIEKDITENPERIPGNVKIVKVDFDTEDELRSKYNVNSQYTFVEIDENGNEIDQWSSISFNSLLNRLEN